MLSPLKRVIKTLELEIPDCVPVLVRSMAQNLQYEYAEEYNILPEHEVFFWRDLTPLIALGIDAFDFNLPVKRMELKKIASIENFKGLDAFGRISEKGAYSEGFFTNREIFEKFPPIEMVSESDPKNFKKMIDLAGEKIAIFCSVRGMFELTWEGMGMAAFGRAQRKDIFFINKVISRIEKFSTMQIKMALDEGIKLFSITDDMGFKGGLITSLRFLKEHIFPRYKKIVDLIHKNGGLVYLHSEGNITDALPEIIDCKFDGIQGLTEMDGVNLSHIKKSFGEKIALLGTLEHSPMLDIWTTEKIVSKIQEKFKIAGKNGGLMMGPSAMIDKGCKLESIITMIDAIHKCKY